MYNKIISFLIFILSAKVIAEDKNINKKIEDKCNKKDMQLCYDTILNYHYVLENEKQKNLFKYICEKSSIIDACYFYGTYVYKEEINKDDKININLVRDIFNMACLKNNVPSCTILGEIELIEGNYIKAKTAYSKACLLLRKWEADAQSIPHNGKKMPIADGVLAKSGYVKLYKDDLCNKHGFSTSHFCMPYEQDPCSEILKINKYIFLKK